MLTRRSLLLSAPALGIAAAAARGAVVGTARAEGAPWRIVTEYPATAMPGEGIAHFATAVGRLSENALRVDAGFDAPDGLRSATMLDAVARGRVEAADAFTGAMAAEDAVFALSALPFLAASAEDAQRLLRVARPAYAAALARRGATLLYATPWPPTGIWSRAPLTDLASLKGLRIRTYDKAGTTVLRGVGAEPQQISFADALPRLKAGELDAVLSSGDGGAGARLWEVLPHFTEVNYASPLSLAFCNTGTLEALNPRLAEAVRQAGVETESRQVEALRGRLEANQRRMRDNGVSIHESAPVRSALTEAAKPVIADWATQVEGGRAILAAFQAG